MEINLIRLWFGKLLDALRFRAPHPEGDPGSGQLIKSFEVSSDGTTIRGRVFYPVPRPARQYPVVVICHGIPGSGAARPADDPGYEGLARDVTALGIAAVIFNFRGCGDSGGNFDIMGWTRDLDAVLAGVLNTPYIDPERVMLLGFSGGGAAAIYVAADRASVYGLAVVGTPSDFGIFEDKPEKIVDDFRARGIIRDANFPPNLDAWMGGFKEIEPRRWISYFKGQYLLIVHGDADELIPVEQAQELLAHAPAGTARLSIIPGGVHRLRLDPRCLKTLEAWFMEILGWKD